MKRLIAPAVVLAMLGGCDKGVTPSGNGQAPAVAAVQAPAGTDWLNTVSATPEGGFVMGNPNAAIKLVEIGSLTCPHCAEFSKNAAGPLKDLVKSGKISWEYRNYVRDQVDMVATLLARCGGPQPFFPMMEQLYADQAKWFGALQTAAPTLNTIQSLPPAQQFQRIAQAAGFIDFVAQRGIGSVQANACLADEAATDRLVKMVSAANKLDIPGTPTFMINGAIVPNVATWETLQPALKTAGA